VKADAVALLSGGIDSPVACHLMMERGLELQAVHFSQRPHTDEAPERKAEALVTLLGIPRMRILDVGPYFEEFVRSCQHRYYFVLTKRFMLRLAERIALDEGASFLVTGESLGQVSSQTLRNLATIDAAVALPVLRPLLGFDKVEIIRIAQRIGTFEVSKGPELCDLLGPEKPATRAGVEVIEREEAKVPYEEMLQQALESSRVLDRPGEAR
jgi:thiamine biosynthesis protein ThiI